MKIFRVRSTNLRTLLDEAGTAAELARRATFDRVRLEYLLAGRETINFRDARKIENGMDKEHGWMDTEHTEADTDMAGIT